MPFWLEANYIFLRTSHFFSLSSFSPIPQQQIMTTETPQHGESRSETSWSMDTSSNAALTGTQQPRRQQLVHPKAANAPTKDMTQDEYLKIVHKTGSSKNKKQHPIECQYIHVEVNSRQLAIYHTAGIRSELRNQFIAARNGRHPWSIEAYFHAVCETEHHHAVSSRIFADAFLIRVPESGTNRH